MMNNKKLGLTLGDINGIGIEVAIKALNKIENADNIVLFGSKKVFDYHVKFLQIEPLFNYEFVDIDIDENLKNIDKTVNWGKNDINSGFISFYSLKKAIDFANENKINALVTAPTSKAAMNMAGFHFNGQTEILQKYLKNNNETEKNAQMLFCTNEGFRVLLLTRHLSLKDVPKAINKEMIITNVVEINSILINDFKINKPKIAFCALNPHAGEAGLLGDEEIKIINPAIKELKAKNIDVNGAFSADTLFTLNNISKFDLFISCYHDQGLIPIKMLYFDKTVNTTVGLSKIRTSPTHGTAFDIAGKNLANEASMKEAIKLAMKLA